MFTGIVRERGRVVDAEERDGNIRLRVDAPETAPSVAVGDSVSISGCCLTAVDVNGATVAFDAVPETLRRSSLADIRPGQEVNVESALRVGDPLGGHYVQGHVDGVGRVRVVASERDGHAVWIEAAPEILRYCVEKGSIAVDGVALTVTELEADAFAVALVPHTLALTTLGALAPGQPVNLEADVLAKYVEKLLPPR